MNTKIKDLLGVAKPCPFCGMTVSPSDDDTLYPSGIAWKAHTDGEMTHNSYFHVHDGREKDGVCYTMHCPTTAGGCGAEITGHTAEEAVEKWNRRAEK